MNRSAELAASRSQCTTHNDEVEQESIEIQTDLELTGGTQSDVETLAPSTSPPFLSPKIIYTKKGENQEDEREQVRGTGTGLL